MNAVMERRQEGEVDSSYSDFVTRYTAVCRSTNQMVRNAVRCEEDDPYMNLGINALLQFGLKSVREKILRGTAHTPEIFCGI